MGCALSKEDAEGAVARCRECKHLLQAAVAARHALAGAHAGHAAALKNVGAALSDYASGEAHDGLLRSASAAAALGSSGGGAKAALALPPPPPVPVEEAPPLVRSMSAPDLPLQRPIRKKPSGEAAIIEEVDGAEGEGDGEDARRLELEEAQLQPPPPPPTQLLPPTRSPPPLPPETEHKPAVAEGGSWNEFIFRSQDGIPIPQPTLESSAAEPSWAPERREAAPPPPLPEPEKQPPPPASAEDVAEGKKPAVEAGARRPLRQKAAMKAESKKGRAVVLMPPRPARLGDILRTLDEHFVQASQSAHEVSKLLEAARMHYHSNFAETRGFVDHSARVMQVITWNRSFKGIPQPENVRNELDDNEWETHGTILDKLLAWEKKLCHEVMLTGDKIFAGYEEIIAALKNIESMLKKMIAAKEKAQAVVVDLRQHKEQKQWWPCHGNGVATAASSFGKANTGSSSDAGMAFSKVATQSSISIQMVDTATTKGVKGVTTAFPEDVLFEVFSRVLSAMDLFCCAVTCERWLRLLTNPTFLRRHWLDHASSLLGFFQQRSFARTNRQMKR